MGVTAGATPSVKTAVVTLLSAMMVLVPALGSPHEEMLQDTLKSMLVAFFALASALFFFWRIHRKTAIIKLHGLMWLPFGLMIFALVSMAWSHTYLAGVEAIRWFLFSLILFLGANSITLAGVTYVAWGVHIGAVIASLWAALQFWFDFEFFAQGANPASTFVNRNFFAEYLVCTLPFSVLLLSRVKEKASVFLLTFSIGFNVVALLMTGTRSALVGLLLLTLLIPIFAILFRKQVTSDNWRIWHCFLLVLLLVGTVLSMSTIPTKNSKLLAEFGPGGSLGRAVTRAVSIAKPSEYETGSFSVRTTMWRETQRMIYEHPVTGVGAGAWEVEVPRFQDSGMQLETDYYAHNEILQLIAEYGLVGWLFLFGLIAFLLHATYVTWANTTTQGLQEAPVRALVLASLLAFLLVSNAGFAWRMATTGALFAVSLAILMASDIRLLGSTSGTKNTLRITPKTTWLILYLLAILTTVAIYISQQAIECESKLVRAIKLAVTISHSPNPNDIRWDPAKAKLLKLTHEGIAINPNYRKLTPIIADSLAGWGDWKNAIWIWESVLASRPHIVAMASNLARGHMQLGEYGKAHEYLGRVQYLQPNTPASKILEILLWSRTGRLHDAAQSSRKMLRAGSTDRDLLQTAYILGIQTKDIDLTVQALEIGIRTWPDRAADGWLKLGDIYSGKNWPDEKRALQSYESALSVAPPAYRTAVLSRIPPAYRKKILP